MATEATSAATKSGKGLKSGLITELATFFTVKPGHAQQLKDELAKRFPSAQDPVGKVPPAVLRKVGNHHVKHYLFDNDTRLVMILSFDGTLEKYLTDALSMLGVKNFFEWLQHCNEVPPDLLEMNVPQMVELLGSAQVEAFDYIEAVSDMTIQQIEKAQKLMAAFQQVLDNPAAAEALKNPALKPLLDLAAA
jgi:hypothetical protein